MANLKNVGLFGIVLAISSPANAQTAIKLQSLDGGSGQVEIVSVKNYYGRCGASVVQILGVAEDHGDFFTVDSAGSNSAIVVLGDDGSAEIRRELSDHNGVACVGPASSPKVLIWSNCGGTACGDDFDFTVVTTGTPRIISDPDSGCDAACAARLTRSDLPHKINSR